MARKIGAASAAVVAALAGQALAQPHNFIGPAQGNWHTATYWNPNGIPGVNPPGVDVVIGQGMHAWLYNSPAPTVGTLTVAGQLSTWSPITIAGAAQLTHVDIYSTGTTGAIVCGQLNLTGQNSTWRAGRIIGTIEQGGTLYIGGTGGSGGSPSLTGTFNNTASVLQNARLYLYNQSVINNTGPWTLHHSLSDGVGQGGNGGTFKNLPGGTLLSSSSISDVTTRFESDSLIQLGAGGDLYLAGPLTRINGPIQLQGNSTLRINQSALPPATVSVSGNFTGSGNVRLENMALCSVPAGITSALDPLSTSGLRIELGTGQVQLGGSLNNDGKFAWYTGRISGPGFVRNRTGGNMIFGVGASTLAVLATEMFNDAYIFVQGAPRLDNATLHNNAQGTIDLYRGSLAVTTGSTGQVRNAGLIHKPPSPFGNSFLQVPLTMLDGGRIRIEDYGIYLQSGSVWSGATTTELGPATSARLFFSAGEHTVQSGTHTFTGLGAVEVSTNAELFVPNGRIINEMSITQGSFRIPGHLYVGAPNGFLNRGHLRLSGSYDGFSLSDPPLVNEALMSLESGEVIGPVFNPGTIRVSGSSHLGTSGSFFSRIVNPLSGTIVFDGSCSIESHSAEAGIVNEGVVTKTGASSQGVLYGPGFVDNLGTVSVLEGTLNIACRVVNIQGATLTGGVWTAFPGTQLLLPGPITELGGGAEVNGNSQSCPWLRDVLFNRGRMRFNGNHTHQVPMQNTSGGMMQIDAPAQATFPGGVENGDGSSILDEITEVPVISDGPQARLITPTLNNYARLIPGGHDEPGYFNLTGNLVMHSTGRILSELGGIEPSSEYDTVAIIGAAALDGAVQLSLIDGFTPTPGQQFTILSATGGITGTFDDILPPPGVSSLSFSPIYTPTTVVVQVGAALCYANCDGSTAQPVLNVADFTCFLQRFAAANPYANCDASTAPPVLNVADFTCFLQRFAAGCR